MLDVNKTENAFALMAALTLNAYVVLKGILPNKTSSGCGVRRLDNAHIVRCHCL